MIKKQIVVDNILTTYSDNEVSSKNILVILPGWSHHSDYWKSISEKTISVRVVCLDLPSFGGTGYLPGIPGTEEYVNFVLGFLKKLGTKNYFLLGHSFGGQVAVALASKNPQGLNKLLLVSPACIRDKKVKKRSIVFKILKPLVPSFLFRKIFSLVASSNYFKANEKQREILRKILYQDFSDKLRQINVKTYIFWGTEDFEIPNNSKLLASNIPNSKLVVLYNLGHNPHLESPEKLTKHILECIKD